MGDKLMVKGKERWEQFALYVKWSILSVIVRGAKTIP